MRTFSLALSVLLLLVCFAVLPTQAAPSRPRVALMNFICDDNSYRSTQAAADLTAAVQVELMSSADCDWVERADLEKADHELKLLTFGLMDRAEGIRFGRWVKADWAVFGRISTNSASGRELRFEVVDLAHAEVLARSLMTLAPQQGVSLKLDTSAISATAASVRKLIAEASQAVAVDRGKAIVAFLFFAPAAITESPTALSRKVQERLSAEMSNSPLHLLHFQRAAVSSDESELVLSGLARPDRDGKQELADLYLWGTYTSGSISKFDPVQHRFNTENVFQSTLTLWDGNSEPRVVTVAVTNAESEDIISGQIARAILPLLRPSGGVTKSVEARQRASDSVLRQAMTLLGSRGHPSLESVEGRRDWLTMVQMLDTACFIDPMNASAREWATRLHWSNLAGYNSRNEFFFARRRSEAWGKFVTDFGFRTGALTPPSGWGTPDSITKEYVLSAWRPLEMFQFSQYNQAEWGVPRDAGGPELLGWRTQFADEFFARLLRAPDEPAVTARSWEFLDALLAMSGDHFVFSDGARRQRVLELLWPRLLELQRTNPGSFDPDRLHKLTLHYQQLGRPGGEKDLVAELEKKGRRAPTQEPKPRLVRLPRIGILDSDSDSELFNLPSAVFPTSRSGPEEASIHLAAGLGIQSVKAAVFHQGKLWLGLEIPESVVEASGDATGASDLNRLKLNVARLWVLDPKAGTLTRAVGPLSTNAITSLFARGTTLWAAVADSGLVEWDTSRDTVKRYAAAEGLTSTNQYGLAGADAGMFALGGITDLSRLLGGNSKWASVSTDLTGSFGLPYIGEGRQLAVSGNHLLLFNLALLATDLRTNYWVRLDSPLLTGLKGIGRVSRMVGDGSDGFWVASESGLHFVDARGGAIRSQLLEQSFSLPPAPQIQLPPGMAVPIALQPHPPAAELDRLLSSVMELRHRWASAARTNDAVPNPFKPAWRLPGPPLTLAMDGGLLWVLTADPTTVYSSWLLLYDPARRKWINSAQIRGDRPTLIARDGKAWVISAAPNEMEVHTFDRQHWLSTPAEQWVSDAVSANELEAWLSKLSPRQEALCRIFWGEPERAVAILSDQNELDSSPECLFLLALANDPDALNRPDEQRKYTQRLLEEFPDNRLARFTLSQQKLNQVRARAAERKNSPAASTVPRRPLSGNRSELAAQRAAAILRDYDADGDGKLSVEELAVACELEPERLPFTPYPFYPDKPLESARNLLSGFYVNPGGSLDLATLQRGFLVHPLRSELIAPGARNPALHPPHQPGIPSHP